MPYQYQPPDLVGLYLSAQQAAQNRERMKLLKQQQEAEGFALERAQLEPEALQAHYSRGDSELLQTVNPRLYEELKGNEAQRAVAFEQAQKQRAEAQGSMADAAQQRALRTANFQRMMAQAPAHLRPQLEQKFYEGVQNGMFDRVEMTGPNTTPQQAQAISAQGEAMAGALQPQKPEDFGELGNKLRAEGLAPGSPEWHRRARQLNERGGVNINVGGKELPVSAATDMAGTTASLGSLDDLMSSFATNIGGDGLLDQLGAKVMSFAPNSQETIYNQKADLIAQAIGTKLEKGKLTDDDFKTKYRNAVPRPGDSAEAAQAKIKNLSEMIRRFDAEERKALKASGYKVPEPSPQTTSPEQPSNKPRGAEAPAPVKIPQPAQGIGLAIQDEIKGGLTPEAAVNKIALKRKLSPQQREKLLKVAKGLHSMMGPVDAMKARPLGLDEALNEQ